jgi:hypothetical protein
MTLFGHKIAAQTNIGLVVVDSVINQLFSCWELFCCQTQTQLSPSQVAYTGATYMYLHNWSTHFLYKRSRKTGKVHLVG